MAVKFHIISSGIFRRRNDPQQMFSFWERRNDWLPTWSSRNKEDVTNALQVDYIRVYDYDPNSRGSWYWYQTDGNANSIYDHYF